MIAAPSLRTPDRARPRSVERSVTWTAMGGTVRVRLACDERMERQAARDLRLLEGRVGAWAARLTRFSADSDLSMLDRDPRASSTPIRPTLGGALEAAMAVGDRTGGLVDITLLDARLAAETGADPDPRSGRWWLSGSQRHRVVRRDGRVSFDLDGVAKGWIADRALALCASYPAAMVDADGDIAIRVDASAPWDVAVADPRTGSADLAVLRVPPHARGRGLGIATSGTSVHRWRHPRGDRHHIIDPRTGRSARTDVVQATVVADSALDAEALAKATVILGADGALDMLEGSDALAAVLLLEDGDVVATTRSLDWLA